MPKKISEKEVPTLKEISKSLNREQKEAIAKEYGVHLNTVYNVLKGRTNRFDILKTCLIVYKKNMRILDKVKVEPAI
jgi:predicted transcriptional regulator